MLRQAFGLGAQILKANFKKNQVPFKLTFSITFRCQSKCKTCNIWRMKPENELTLQEIEKFAAKARYFRWINLTGGEVSLRDDLVDICRIFSKNPSVLLLNFASNGLATKIIVEKAKQIIELTIPRKMIGVSLDGAEALNDEIRGIPGDWKKALETYKQLRSLSRKRSDFRTYLGFTLSTYNSGHFLDFFQAVKKEIPDLSPREIHVNLFHQSAHYYQLEGAGGTKEIEATEIDQVLSLRPRFSLNPIDRIENDYLTLAKEFLLTGKTPLPCTAVRNSCFVDSWGNVFPCTIYEKKLGSLRNSDYDLMKILRSPEGQEAKNEAEQLHCPNCWTPCEAYQMILTNAL